MQGAKAPSPEGNGAAADPEADAIVAKVVQAQGELKKS